MKTVFRPDRAPKLPFRDDTETLRIQLGDAYDLVAQLSAESIDLVITSPPYWGLRHYGLEHNWDILNHWKSAGKDQEEIPSYQCYREHDGVLGMEPLPEWYVEHVAEILDVASSCLKPSGSMWVNIGGTYFARWASIRQKGRQGLGDQTRQRRRTPMGGFRQEKQLLLIPSRFAIAMQDRRWMLRNDLIWYKPNVPPRPEKDRLRLAHEHFFHFVKRPKEGRAKYYYDMAKVEDGATDVVTCYARAGENGHTATFPEAVVRRTGSFSIHFAERGVRCAWPYSRDDQPLGLTSFRNTSQPSRVALS